MGKIIIEIQAENSVYQTHRSFDALPIKIGRGYDNDLILGDPFLSENHLLISEGDQGWMIEDLQTKNGTYSKKHQRVIQKSPFSSGDEFIIGKTKIRILNRTHPVPPPKVLVFRSPFIKKISQPINALSITIFMIIIFILDEHMKSFKNTPVAKLLSMNLGIILMIAIWAGLWAFVGRIIKKNAQFTAQFSLCAIFLSALIPANQLMNFIEYAFPDPVITGFITSVLYGVMFMIFLTKSLQVATNISFGKRMMASGLITTLILLIGTLTFYAEKNEFQPYPKSSYTLNPPKTKIIRSKSIDAFMSKSEKIFKE